MDSKKSEEFEKNLVKRTPVFSVIPYGESVNRPVAIDMTAEVRKHAILLLNMNLIFIILNNYNSQYFILFSFQEEPES